MVQFFFKAPGTSKPLFFIVGQTEAVSTRSWKQTKHQMLLFWSMFSSTLFLWALCQVVSPLRYFSRRCCGAVRYCCCVAHIGRSVAHLLFSALSWIAHNSVLNHPDLLVCQFPAVSEPEHSRELLLLSSLRLAVWYKQIYSLWKEGCFGMSRSFISLL